MATVDYHTAGHAFRIAAEGVPDLPGDTVRARRRAVPAAADLVRRLLCHEPRGHAGMYGCFVVPPDDGGAHLGALFWHRDGYSTACGHGTIALGAWAVESGRVRAAPDGLTDVVIDVPSGRVTATVRCAAGRVESVRFRNVPAYVLARAVPVRTTYGAAKADVAYGGAVYASVRAGDLGLIVASAALHELVTAGREIQRELADTADVYGVTLYDELGVDHQRSVTIFGDGQVDRSPSGSGTTARLALLDSDAPVTDAFVHESITGARLVGRVVDRGPEGVTGEIEGMAYRTGEHRFVLDPRDPIGPGFAIA